MQKETKLDPELEKVRDEKCIPVARAIMNDMAVELFDEDATPLVKKLLTHALETDMNIATETSYLPQLILSALSGLNATVQTCDMVPLDDERYKSIAKKILVIMNEENIKLGNVLPEEVIMTFVPVKEKINALFAEEKLNRLEVKYILDSIFTAFTTVNNLFSESLSQASARAEAKLFGIEMMSDLTTKKLNEVLIS